jgi:uncharacterized membrane protein YgcG
MRAILACLVVCTLFASGTIYAQAGYPPPSDTYVSDFANVLSADVETYLREQLAAVENGSDIEMSVVTINSVKDYRTDAGSFEAFATGLFNAWGIGDAARDNGVLLLVAVADRDVRVELGAGYDLARDGDAQDILDENLLPYFRRYDYESGIFNGVRALISEFTGTLPPMPEELSIGSPQATATQPSTQPSPDPLVIGGIIAAGAIGVLVVRRLLRGTDASTAAYEGSPAGYQAEALEQEMREAYERDPQAAAARYQGVDDTSGAWDLFKGREDDDADDHRGSARAPRSSRSSRSSGSSSRRSGFGGGKSRGGGASGKW